jgi:predicted nucleotidyltransferase
MKRIYKKIAERLSESVSIIGAILYGSYARQEETSRSDIDILLISKNEDSKTDIQNLIIELEGEIDRIIQPTIRTLSDLKDTDSGLLQNIFEEGKILFLKEPLELPVGSMLSLRPFVIYSLKLNNLEQKEKAKFNRRLYERKSQKYKYRGLLQELNGKKLAAGCIIVSNSQKEKIEKYFKKFNVSFDQIKVWK